VPRGLCPGSRTLVYKQSLDSVMMGSSGLTPSARLVSCALPAGLGLVGMCGVASAPTLMGDLDNALVAAVISPLGAILLARRDDFVTAALSARHASVIGPSENLS
jgi:hypothetical protein